MSVKIDFTGKKFGRLTVVSLHEKTASGNVWLCICECGNECKARSGHLNSGHKRSCGCLQKETAARNGKKSAKHGMSKQSEYNTWRSMIQRCTNENHTYYEYYGGSGVTVCSRWLNFSNFLEDMGRRPEGYTLDRISNDIGYSKENCKWSTKKEQSQNRKISKIIKTTDGEMVLSEAARLNGLSVSTLSRRLIRGWSVEQALTTRPNKGNKIK